jgi:hypothetical protein
VKNAYAKYDLSLGIGLAQINGKVFRIGEGATMLRGDVPGTGGSCSL